jgi:hypothetical protein
VNNPFSPWKVVVIALAGLVVQGCAAFTGVEPTDLTPILVGKTRTDVEAVVGDPVERNVNGCGEVDTYRYDRGRPPQDNLFALTIVHPAAPLIVGLIAHPFLVHGQKGEIDVVYDPDDTVIKYGPSDPSEWEALFSVNHLWVDQTTQLDVAQRYYEIGMTGDGNQTSMWSCLCNAARLGHVPSQFQLAMSRLKNQEPREPTPETFLASYVPASSNGFASTPFLPAGFEIGATTETITALDQMLSAPPPGDEFCTFEPGEAALKAERGASFSTPPL